MSEQVLNLKNDWEKVKERFRSHFSQDNIEVTRDRCKYSGSGETLVINRDGSLSGYMPLHQSKFSDAEEIVFRDDEVELSSESFSYIFRR
jgi:hypothetical protein